MNPVSVHSANAALLDGTDVVVASYPGAGAALIGNIFLELGLNYVDLYTESLLPDRGARPLPGRSEYRKRLAASGAKDERIGRELGKRVLAKTHRSPQEFVKLGGAILLVRDPRDTLFSYFNWRLSFSEEGERRMFRDFLASDWPLGTRPIDDWVAFHRAWLDQFAALDYSAVIRFEDLKRDPLTALRLVLDVLGIERTEAEVLSAVEASSFSRMRAHEDEHATDATRIMRRGAVGEWVEWYDESYRELLSCSGLAALGKSLGYDLPSARSSRSLGDESEGGAAPQRL